MQPALCKLLRSAALFLMLFLPLIATPITAQTLPTQTLDYWDLGLRIIYPDSWGVPQFIPGQVLLSASPDASTGILDQPAMAIRIVDPVNELNLPKEATLEQIANGLSFGMEVTTTASGATKIADLDAAFVIQDATTQNETGEIKLVAQTIAFRMPDGRVAAVIGISPSAQWSDFSLVLETIRQSITLLKASDYAVPTIGTQTSTFPQGGVQFTFPDGWTDQDVGNNARLYHDKSAGEYADGSGYVNGPQLVILATAMQQGSTLRDALSALLQPDPSTPTDDITVGGQPGVQFSFTDPISGQHVVFVGFLSQDQTILNIFRWSTPELLIEVLKPTFDSVVTSVQYGEITTALAQPNDPGSEPPPPPDPNFYQGIQQTRLDDGTIIIGSPDAQVRIIEFMDFSCPSCALYESVMHEFINTYVREGKVRVELRYLTFVGAERSAAAAYGAFCAGEQGKQMEMHDRLYFLQQTVGSSYFIAENLVNEAVGLGLDGEKFIACMNSGVYDAALATANQMAEAMQVFATPSVFVTKGDASPIQIEITLDTQHLTSAVDNLLAQP